MTALVIALAIVLAALLVKVIVFAPRPQRPQGLARQGNGANLNDFKSRVHHKSQH